jgi:adenylate cyclase
VRVANDRTRVAAHLVRCEDGQQLWAERFDRDLSDIFEIQTEIARTVTATVVGQIEADVISRNRQRPADALESHVLVLRARREIESMSKDGFEAGISILEHALKLDTGNARARAIMALTRVYLEWYFNIGTRMGMAIEDAQSALRLDPREPKAHCALGLAFTIERRFDEASHHFQAGMNSNPNDEQLLVEYGRHLMYVDRPEAGIKSIREAMRLNPFHPSWYWNIVGRCLHTLGRFDEALECFRRMEDHPFYVYGYIASCLAMLGDKDGARTHRERLYALRPDFNLQQFRTIFPYKNTETAERYFGSFAKAEII